MANYFTKTSFVVKATPTQVDWFIRLHKGLLATELAVTTGASVNTVKLDIDIADTVMQVFDDTDHALVNLVSEVDVEFWGNPENPGMWIHGIDVDPHYIGTLLQQFLIKYNITEPIIFQWANDCDRMRMDAFGGGAMIVTQQGLESMDTSQWINDKLTPR